MVRKILILGALTAAGLALVACDNPASGILSNAKTGDCFSVTGKDAYGQPKLIHADCPAGQTSGQSTLPPVASDQASATAANGKTPADAAKSSPPALPSPSATTTAASAAPVCQPAVATSACAVPAAAPAYHAPRYYPRAVHYGRVRRVWRTHKVTHRRHGKLVTEVVTEYVAADGNEVTTAGPYAPAPPIPDTYVLGEHPVYHPPVAPPRDQYYDGGRYEGRADSRSYESHAYSSSHSGPPPRPCNCDRPSRPHYDPDGYLTWPNKSPY
jgi:hypothetical protein